MASQARAFQQACRLRSQPAAAASIRFEKPQADATTTTLLLLTTTSPPSYASHNSTSRPQIRTLSRMVSRPALSLPTSGQAFRHASTSSSSSSNTPRRAISVTSDDGRYNWSELSTSEKAARGTQQTFNFLVVAAGLVGTVRFFSFLFVSLKLCRSQARDHLGSPHPKHTDIFHRSKIHRPRYPTSCTKNSSPRTRRRSNSTPQCHV